MRRISLPYPNQPCPLHLDTPTPPVFGYLLYLQMPLICLDAPIHLDSPMPLGIPHMFEHPLCLDTPIHLDAPICLDTPICSDASIHLDTCIPMEVQTPLYIQIPHTFGHPPYVQMPSLCSDTSHMATHFSQLWPLLLLSLFGWSVSLLSPFNLVAERSNEEDPPYPTPISLQQLRVEVTWAMRSIHPTIHLSWAVESWSDMSNEEAHPTLPLHWSSAVESWSYMSNEENPPYPMLH